MGKTSPKELVQKLKTLGYEVKWDTKNSFYIENVSFAGEEWNHCIFTFYKNKLLAVDFGLTYGSSSLFESFVSTAKEKYPNCVLKEITNEPKHKLISIQNEIACLGIGCNDSNGPDETILNLHYCDTALSMQQNDARKNDL